MMKSEARKKYAQIRNSISSKDVKDEIINSAFLNSVIYKNAKELLCYYPVKSEVSTLNIINRALIDNKAVLLPVCLEAKGIMKFFRISSLNDLKIGKYGINEPDSSMCREYNSFSSPVCLVPAYAYDLSGYRLGYGGGYYDRFLADFNNLKVGLCYDELLVNQLPRDKYDVKVNYIITEKQKIIVSEEE